MTDLLWISYCAPYKQVAHAGGKNHYYWLKKIEEDKEFDIKLVTCCASNEYEAFQAMEYPFECFCCVASNSRFGKLWQKLQSLVLAPYSVFRFAGSIAMYKILYIRKVVRSLKRQGYKPDTVLLHWTQMGFLHDWIRRLFPSAKLVIMEEDVSFLRTQRELDASTGFMKLVKAVLHQVMCSGELRMCTDADGVIVTNRKDAAILIENGIHEEKILHTISYYQDLSEIEPKRGSLKILFYGAMNRRENIDAAAWFAKSVMPELRHSAPYEFVILGGNPADEIKRLANEYITVTGFVDDIRPYFQDALCLVAPLFSGAGIKIKILEGMSSGIPVLTNEIGIEGIMAENGVEYCQCNAVEDYVATITQLSENPELAALIGANGRTLVLKQFNAESSVGQFREVLKSCE